MLAVLSESRMLSVLTFGLTLMFLFSFPLKIQSQGIFSPTVDSVRIGTSAYASNTNPMVLSNSATVTSFHVNGVVSDLDGWAEISTVSVKLHRSGVNWWCTTDNNDCYSHPACSFQNSTGTTRDYNCEIEVSYFADPTDAGSQYSSQTWSAYVTVTDSFWWQGSSSSTNELSSLLSIASSGSIAYGDMDAGDTSTSSSILTIINKGNVSMDVEASSTGMTCTNGSIAPTYQKWDTWDTSWATMSKTLNSFAQTSSLFLPQQTNDFFQNTDDMYWRINIPTSGAGGACSGTTDIIAVEA